MCLVGIAWQQHPRYALVLAANRDELHARPAAPASWWPDAGQIYGGRDLEAGGTWLAVARDGRFAAVTNIAGSAELDGDFESRGQLISDYLAASHTARKFANRLESTHARYRPFRLALGDTNRLHLFESLGAGRSRRREFEPGVHSLTNAPGDDPWPKAKWIRDRLAELARRDTIDHARLLQVLATQRIPDDDNVDAPIEQRYRCAPFIRHEIYGTRASSVVTLTHDGILSMTEQQYDAAGLPAGRANLEINIE